MLGHRAVRLYPIYHPAAALYTPSMLETLRADFARLPELLATAPPPQPEAIEAVPEIEPEPEPEVQATEAAPPGEPAEPEPSPDQLGLF